MTIDPVRAATDAAVVDAMLRAGRLTRAEIATQAGVSKPTASESAKRLSEAGVLVEAGRQEGGRGRVGLYYRLAEDAGLALAIHAGAGRIVGECVGAVGPVRHQVQRSVGVTIDAARLQAELLDVVSELEHRAGRSVARRAVSIADPVDLQGRLVHLPGSPFVLGAADLGKVVDPSGVVDNDVNWAASAEVGPDAPDSFLYVHLGAGLGGAVVDAGATVRGQGVAGEIAYLLTADASGTARPLLDVLRRLGLCLSGSSALDIERVQHVLADEPQAVIAALAGALTSAVALLDPQSVIVGGPWGAAALAAGLAQALNARTYRPVDVRAASIEEAPLAGARLRAREFARAELLARGSGEMRPAPAPHTRVTSSA